MYACSWPDTACQSVEQGIFADDLHHQVRQNSLVPPADVTGDMSCHEVYTCFSMVAVHCRLRITHAGDLVDTGVLLAIQQLVVAQLVVFAGCLNFLHEPVHPE